MIIRIIPVGNISANFIENIRREIKNTFSYRVAVLESVDFPKAETFNQFHRQYDAEKLLNKLLQTRPGKFIDKDIKTIFLADEDIFYRDMSYVFGVTDLTTSSSLVNINKLKSESIFVTNERLSKEVVHEIGHLLGLQHCNRQFCVMNYSRSVRHVDEKRKEFCMFCKYSLRDKGIEL